MTRHLEPVPDPREEPSGRAWGDEGFDELDALRPRPSWWRWVAIVVVVAMVVATPAAYALYLLLR